MSAPAPQDGTTALLDALLAQNSARNAHAARVFGWAAPGIPNQDPNSPPPGYGELPGAGWAFIDDPAARQRAEVQTTPEAVRNALLRTIETTAQAARLPYGEEHDKSKSGDMILKAAQAYLLLDPSVDATTGVPVIAGAVADAAKQMAVGSQQSQQAPGTATSLPRKTVGTATMPPRVTTSAMDALNEMHQNLATVLKGGRADSPLPKPRT